MSDAQSGCEWTGWCGPAEMHVTAPVGGRHGARGVER